MTIFHSLLSSSQSSLADIYIKNASVTDPTQQAAIRAFNATIAGSNSISSNILSKIRDMNIFFGGNLANASIKYKSDPDIPTLLNNGSTAFTDSNYGATTGITNPTANSRELDTQFIIDSRGLSYSNFCIGVASINDVSNDGSAGNYMIDNKPSGAPGLFLNKSNFGVNGGGLQVVFGNQDNCNNFTTVSSNGNAVFVRDFSNLITAGQATPVVTLDSNLSLFTGKSQGAVVNTKASIGAYYIASYLTYNEILILNTALRTLFKATGRWSQTSDNCVVLGDSITYGVGASAYNKKYAYLYAQNQGLTLRNCGTSGSQFLNTNGVLPAQYTRVPELLNYEFGSNAQFVFMGGINDCRTDTGATGTKTAAFQAQLEASIQLCIDAGIPASRIITPSIPWVNDGTPQTRMDAYVAVQMAAAHNKGTKYADVNTAMKNGGGAALLTGDNIHPNDTGHALIASTIATATFV